MMHDPARAGSLEGTLTILDIVNSPTAFCQRYRDGPEGWPALLRQELPDLTDADIEWLSDLSEEMEQYEPPRPTPIAVMDSMDADEQNLEGNFFGEAVLMMELPKRHSTPSEGGRFAPSQTNLKSDRLRGN